MAVIHSACMLARDYASAGSDTGLLDPQVWLPSSSDSYQGVSCGTVAQSTASRAAFTLPPLAPKGPCSAAGARQLGHMSELQRIPRPRFRLANQRPTATRRSLLNDFDAVEDCLDDSSAQPFIDHGCNASSLIKAHVANCYQQQHSQQQQQWHDWYLCKDNGFASSKVLS